MIIPAEIVAAAQASHAKFYPKGCFTSVALAQYGCESAWGKSLAGTYNFFGIKANAAQVAAGKYTAHTTKEQRADGSYVRIVAKFANYDNVQDAFDAHNTLLTSAHYRDCENAQTPEAYCRALHTCGYATELDYADILINIINESNLKQYDLLMTKEKVDMTDDATVARVTPTVAQAVRVDWGSWIAQLLDHEKPIIEAAASGGISLALHQLPFGTLVSAFIGPTLVQQYVDQALAAVEPLLASKSLSVPASSAVATIAAQMVNANEPSLAKLLGSELDTLLNAAVSKLGIA